MISIRSKRAMTLIEIIVAMTLVAVMAVAASAYLVHVKIFQTASGNDLQALYFVNKYIEELINSDYVSIAAPDTPIALPQGNPIADNFNGMYDYNVVPGRWAGGDPDSEYKIITMSVTWNDGKDRALALKALIGKKDRQL